MASRELIEERAYQLWVARGRSHGSHEEDWLEAERQLRTADGTQEASRNGAEGEREGEKAQTPNASNSAGPTASGSPASTARRGSGSAAGVAMKSNGSRGSERHPVAETDDVPRSAPGDTGAG